MSIFTCACERRFLRFIYKSTCIGGSDKISTQMSLRVTDIQDVKLQAQEAMKLEMRAVYDRYKSNGYAMSEQELKEFFGSLTLEFLEDDTDTLVSYDPELVGSIVLENTDSEESYDAEVLHLSDDDQDLDGLEVEDA